MSRYIDADEYPSRDWMIDFLYDCGIRADISIEDIADELLLLVSNIPTADVVEVKQGRWEYLYDGNYKCSECGSWWCCTDSQIDEMNFCPNCGAEMEHD